MTEKRAAEHSEKPATGLEELMRISESENRYYEALREKYNIVVEQCRNCWKIGRHTTQKCVHEKPVCARCGSDETHAREACFVMCFRCGEIGAEAFHESCPRRKVDIMRQALIKKYDLDAKTARDVSRGKLSILEVTEKGFSGSSDP